MFTLDGSCWLTPGEQEEAIAGLVRWGLLKWNNQRTLPLKSGGRTDIYENLRLTRNTPEAMRFFAELYASPLRRLRVDRFVEVPEAVSPLAGHISAITDIPMVTIREEVKGGRVAKGKILGDFKPGERVAIIDNVITDGASKLPSLTALRSAAVEVAAIVVMVDRQQGWKKKLAEAGFGNISVWSGMTLHDVRKFLVTQGLMERCDPAVEEKNPIIVALDGKDWDEILPLVDRLRTTGCIFKVNDLLVDQGIANLLPNLSVYGRVMADLKGHDIPNTVGNICRRLRACPPWAVTVHASGERTTADASGKIKMIEAVKKELDGLSTKVLAVTVLTSIDPESCQEIYGRQPLEQTLKLTEIVSKGGVDGFVCSPKEVGALRTEYPDKVLVTAGVRSPGKDTQDQMRTDTPKGAKDAGADHLVMGRQILQAPDPVAEVFRVLNKELGIGMEQ